MLRPAFLDCFASNGLLGTTLGRWNGLVEVGRWEELDEVSIQAGRKAAKTAWPPRHIGFQHLQLEGEVGTFINKAVDLRTC